MHIHNSTVNTSKKYVDGISGCGCRANRLYESDLIAASCCLHSRLNGPNDISTSILCRVSTLYISLVISPI